MWLDIKECDDSNLARGVKAVQQLDLRQLWRHTNLLTYKMFFRVSTLRLVPAMAHTRSRWPHIHVANVVVFTKTLSKVRYLEFKVCVI